MRDIGRSVIVDEIKRINIYYETARKTSDVSGMFTLRQTLDYLAYLRDKINKEIATEKIS